MTTTYKNRMPSSSVSVLAYLREALSMHFVRRLHIDRSREFC